MFKILFFFLEINKLFLIVFSTFLQNVFKATILSSPWVSELFSGNLRNKNLRALKVLKGLYYFHGH